MNPLGADGWLFCLHDLRMRLDILGVQYVRAPQMPVSIMLYALCVVFGLEWGLNHFPLSWLPITNRPGRGCRLSPSHPNGNRNDRAMRMTSSAETTLNACHLRALLEVFRDTHPIILKLFTVPVFITLNLLTSRVCLIFHGGEFAVYPHQMRQLCSKSEGPPCLLIIDGVNFLWCRGTRLKDKTLHVKVTVDRLAIVHHLRRALKADWHHGAIITSLNILGAWPSDRDQYTPGFVMILFFLFGF